MVCRLAGRTWLAALLLLFRESEKIWLAGLLLLPPKLLWNFGIGRAADHCFYNKHGDRMLTFDPFTGRSWPRQEGYCHLCPRPIPPGLPPCAATV